MPAPNEVALFVRGLAALRVPYMVTGATAEIIYGQPRVTNDLDVVLALDEQAAARIETVFPSPGFYVPPVEVIRVEQVRRRHGHFIIIHHATGYKADVFIAGSDPLHAWALPRRRRVPWTAELTIEVAPPEYVILRKLEYYREGGSTKHPADIRAMLTVTPVDVTLIEEWAARLGVEAVWSQVQAG
ncbi:MAG: hypothetical protein A3G75_02925 [Verrucomicrobia bacterium RIFCSPLOWO2_12_FULL_64_8]|nr:MAG: hypothetical protein A3G75_02925 [Verrucomicrobia bacterium RIFCSPLOWO2_12_FULL_64_8]